jgi:class 3 adenylate cyclase
MMDEPTCAIDGGGAMASRTLAIMFTDIQGFTDRTSAASRKDVTDLLRRHEALLVPAFDAFGGTVVKTIGDAFLVTFAGPTDAVLCGIAIQEILRQHNATAEEKHRIDVRVAINVGDVEITANDVYGEPVNIAARLEGIAEAGQVYFTEAVYQTMNRREVPSSEIGERIFKGIPHPIRIYKVVDDHVDLACSLAQRVRAGATARRSRTFDAARTRVHARGRAFAAGIAAITAVVAVALVLVLWRSGRERALETAGDLMARGQAAAALDALDPVLASTPGDVEAAAQAVAAAQAHIDAARKEARFADARDWLRTQIEARTYLALLAPQVAVLDAEAAIASALADPARSAARYIPESLEQALARAPGRADVLALAAARFANALYAGRWPEPATAVLLYEQVLALDASRANDEMREHLCRALEVGPLDYGRIERTQALLLTHFREPALTWARQALAGGSPAAVASAYTLLAQADSGAVGDPIVRAKYALTSDPSFYSNNVRDALDAALETFRAVDDPAQREHILRLYRLSVERTAIERRKAQLRAHESALLALWSPAAP